MPPNKNLYRLEHIIECIEKIESIAINISLIEFKDNWVIQDAVIRNLEIIGEAVRAIDDDLKHKYDNVPWSQAMGMRNILIHEYFRVDLDAVWVTIQENLPELKQQIESILTDLKN